MYVCMQGQSLLHVLCGKGQVDAVAAVLKIGVDVDLLDKVGFYIVQNNILNNNKRFYRFQILQNGTTCLLVALSTGLYSMTALLLRSGADISAADQVIKAKTYTITTNATTTTTTTTTITTSQ